MTRSTIFDKADEKKHSVVYKSSAPDAIAPSVYVLKSALGSPYPPKIKLTLEPAE